ncbi:PREDICTED: UPF0184 protein C9orf16 homolog isoform X2 [Colobus angolensis palliatus]|uniref:UPF0184 protein C9orf16 homolog isoform X2 n=1 Tax=Colobus angolensis palliatus TaxID=336983 RepID=UPI0005F3B40C|nr:PREDICTED: UPF0184 protein C9orf16 homolog isoform X2 [Colobus angolensis palliatus]
MSGPNGDLGMPVEAGAEGEEDGFGEAERICCHQLHAGPDQLLSGPPGGEERPPPRPPPGAAGVQPADTPGVPAAARGGPQ